MRKPSHQQVVGDSGSFLLSGSLLPWHYSECLCSSGTTRADQRAEIRRLSQHLVNEPSDLGGQLVHQILGGIPDALVLEALGDRALPDDDLVRIALGAGVGD